jgi:hypothetical protein
MQITSHTLSEKEYFSEGRDLSGRKVSPAALNWTKAIDVVKAGKYSAVKDEPKDSPYNPCTNIEIGLSILKDKYNICWKEYGNSVKTMACAVCFYNGRTDT